MELDCAGRRISLDRTRIMGILNVTPDSFSDGGRWQHREAALGQAQSMYEAGADIIDVGGESTRPGAAAVGLQQELDRVIPVIETITGRFPVPVSIDTSKPEVMREAVMAGAGMINDVCALRQPGALQTAAGLAVPVCLMHMQGTPRVMQDNPFYRDVVTEVRDELLERVRACQQQGIRSKNILLDPGFGFGKTLDHNIELFRALPTLVAGGYPVIVGVSRKAMIGQLTGRALANRMPGSIAAAALAAIHGAAFVRVHDVEETRDALKITTALFSANT